MLPLDDTAVQGAVVVVILVAWMLRLTIFAVTEADVRRIVREELDRQKEQPE